jgi:uncharacterized protein YqeY
MKLKAIRTRKIKLRRKQWQIQHRSELTDAEIADMAVAAQAAADQQAAAEAEAAAVAAAKEAGQAKLAALGLTAEEIAALTK